MSTLTYTYLKFREIRTPRFILSSLVKKLSPRVCEFPLVRVGQSNDGGYLIPKNLKGIDGLISPGVGNSTSFEDEIYSRFMIPTVCCDGTVYLNTKSKPHIKFINKNLGAKKSDESTTLEEMLGEISKTKSNSGKYMLQMDIEFAEWKILRKVSESTLRKFSIIIIEFHGFTLIRNFLTYVFFLSPGLRKLLKDFVPVHMHPNNGGGKKQIHQYEIPEIVEFTFVRKNGNLGRKPYAKLPHEQDSSNVSIHSEIAPLKGWPGYFV